ncbi:unnamed protein product [Paramecium primaurelia]|uniref:Uncharacterized protein n=1 Tax=Paramecium primaurelia TaxID=5886 RepID=A0A8S1L8Z3_PARPR|nr:unnamed protein product [Paramecium primaurelia]
MSIQKRKRIFDSSDDHSPIRIVQKYCAANLCFDEDTKNHFIKEIEERKKKISSIQVSFTKEEVDKVRDYTLNKLNLTAQQIQKQINQIKPTEINHKTFEDKAIDFENKRNKIYTKFQEDIKVIDQSISNCITEQELQQQLSKYKVPATCITKWTCDGFLEQSLAEIQNFSTEIHKQLNGYSKQLQPPPSSDIQQLNSLLESTNNYDELQCDMLELEKQMAEFQKQLELEV